MSIIWNTGAAAERHRLKLKKKKAASHKPQAASAKLQEGIDYEVDNIDDYIKRVKSNKRLETDTIKR